MKRIYKSIYGIFRILWRSLFYHYNSSRRVAKINNDWRTLLNEYNDFVRLNKDAQYGVCISSFGSQEEYKYVGAQYYKGKVYFIPNSSEKLLSLNSTTYKVDEVASLASGSFKWTGGCIFKGCLYSFPRTENNMMSVDTNTRKIDLYSLSSSYSREHHYGGVCMPNGLVVQPPRDTNSILIWDLEKKTCKEVEIVPKWTRINFRYCGSVLHPNGYVYLLPEKNERVIKFNPETLEWKYIGVKLTAYVFDAAVAVDGNIYGYSAYKKGIIKIDVTTDKVEIIHQEIDSGAYGTKVGINGKLYSVPGNGMYVWEYDVENDVLMKVVDLKDNQKAKYAGGCVAPNGDIYFCPATTKNIMILKSNSNVQIPKNIYEKYYVDNY